MEIVGYSMAVVIGVSLGLIGGGGSILAVPVLAYLFSFDEKVATAYSLFVVGVAALLGGLRQNKHHNVDWRTAIIFGLPAIVGVWVIRHYVIPILPEVLLTIGDFEFTRRMGMFGLFSILMLWAAYTMLSDKESKSGTGEVTYNYPLIVAEGLVVGSITGFVGAGGGFLIIPALVVLANLDIKKAIGTSLIIIALKSILGFFLGDAIQMKIDWSFLLGFTAVAVVGIFLGVYIGKFIEGKKLQKGFGYFIIGMALFMFGMEFIVKL
ncbi:MAG: sulfite exporter TauE/SafE family protein [Thermonemataceae bacterium]